MIDNKPKPTILSQKLRLGLCCINTILRTQKPPIFCSRTCSRKNFTIEIAKKKALQNIEDIIKLIEWNEQNNIRCFRLSSDIFPHFVDDQTQAYSIDFAKPLLLQVGQIAKKYGHRILMHPGQYHQVGAQNPEIFEKTKISLAHHAEILDCMGIDDNGVLIVHGGGVYESKENTKKRWIEQFHLLPSNVKKRLVIENCERSYSTEDCLEISQKCGIPVVFDFHHYYCWSLIHGHGTQKSITELIPDLIKSWGIRRVLMHISEQAPGKKIGAHSDYVEKLPKELFDAIFQYNIAIDLEIEAKMKEQAILLLYYKYPTLIPHNNTPYIERNYQSNFNTYDVTSKQITQKIPINLKKIYHIKTKIPINLKKNITSKQ